MVKLRPVYDRKIPKRPVGERQTGNYFRVHKGSLRDLEINGPGPDTRSGTGTHGLAALIIDINLVSETGILPKWLVILMALARDWLAG